MNEEMESENSLLNKETKTKSDTLELKDKKTINITDGALAVNCDSVETTAEKPVNFVISSNSETSSSKKNAKMALHKTPGTMSTLENGLDGPTTKTAPAVESLPSSSLATSPPKSPPNFLKVPSKNATSSTGKASLSTVAKNFSDQLVVKTEPQDDIKEYVETTMNELLGWYGLPKIDKGDAPQLSLGAYPPQLPLQVPEQSSRRPSQPSVSAPPPISLNANHTNTTRSSNFVDRKTTKSSLETKLPNDTNNNSNDCDDDEDDGLGDDDDDMIDDDLCDDMDDLRDSVSAGSDISTSGLISPGLVGGGVPESERGAAIVCSWCQKNGTKLFTLATPTGVKAFCSEVCFTQCRRASFKKNKVCDWCKHVRHTVNFVDFQDGDIQLQFCSEKCLNQYKMNIFCTEARQHLQHIQNLSVDDNKKGMGDVRSDTRDGEILITPELWLSGSSDSGVRVKKEVVDEGEEREEDDGIRKNGKSNGGYDDVEEPGELRERERERARRTAILETGVRAALSDDSSCSNEEKSGLKLVSPPASQHHSCYSGAESSSMMSKHSEAQTHSEHFHRRDRERIRKLLTDGKCGGSASATSHSRENSMVMSLSKDKADKQPSSTSQKYAPYTSAIRTSTGNSEMNNSHNLLPNWATSQLLAMMPSHSNPSLDVANINSSLNSLRYASSPLLYSSLFGPNPLAVPRRKETSSSTKSRHESRRELLRDRDRSRETDRERKQETCERSVLSVPLSPSTSHSSDGTPGPASTPSLTPGMIPNQNVAPNLVSDFARHLSHPLLTGEFNQAVPIPPYFSDPALAAMFQHPFAYHPRGPVPHAPPPPAPNLHQVAGVAAAVAATASQPAPGPTPLQPQPFPQPPGVPPVTVLVPYPVAVPIPVPVPIPLPITPEKLFAFFKEKSDASKSSAGPSSQGTAQRSTSSCEGRSRASSVSHTINPSPIVSPRPSSKCSSVGCVPFGSSSSMLDAAEPGLVLRNGRESADSIMTLRREIGRSQLKAASTSPCASTSVKRTITPTLQFSLDLSKRARLERRLQHCEEEAIDLSKMSSRSDSPRKSGDSLEKENRELGKSVILGDSDTDSSSQPQNLKVPRIHIISEQPEPPLHQNPASLALPPPLEQSTYSSRRSRILDAPSIPKKSRSPSPERRYVRTVPRDMVEAARRRGLRARVRTK